MAKNFGIDTKGLEIVIAHGSDDIRQAITKGLNKRHHVQASCGTLAELKAHVFEKRPELIVIGVTFPDGDGIDAAIEIGKDHPMPAVIVTAERSLELVKRAMLDHVMAYLIEPISEKDLEAAIIVAWSRYHELSELAEQVQDLKEALDQRKVIERAKGIIMGTNDCSEGEAFGVLRKRAQDERAKMIDVAQEILNSAAEA